MIQCNDDYKNLIDRLIKTANEINGTYEHVGVATKILATTEKVKEIFNISDEFEHDFVEAISRFEEKEIGPYITKEYFSLIPSLKEAMLQIKDDCIETRRCVIKFPAKHCFQSIQFLLRENTIHVVCYMRSCNAIKNLPHDIWICSKMADIFAVYLAEITDIHPYEPHSITMMFGSLHIFKEDVKDVL